MDSNYFYTNIIGPLTFPYTPELDVASNEAHPRCLLPTGPEWGSAHSFTSTLLSDEGDIIVVLA
jgi:hypothetical protein